METYRKATEMDYLALGIRKEGHHQRILAEKMKQGRLRKIFGMKPKGTGEYEWKLPKEVKY